MKNENKKMKSNVEQLCELATRSARSMIAVIDAMAGRGAVTGEELTAVGQLRDNSSQLIQLAEMVEKEDSANESAKVK